MSDVIQTVTETFQPGGYAQFGNGPSISGSWTYQWDVTTNSLVAGQTIISDVVVTGSAGTTTFTSGTVHYAGNAAQGYLPEVLFSTGSTTGLTGYNTLYLDWGGTSASNEAPATLYTGQQPGSRNGQLEAQYTSVKTGNTLYNLHNGGTGGNLVPVITCFTAGTRLLTAAGEVAVEDLAAGDLMVTASGALKPVRWLGRSTITAKFADRLRAAPIRIMAGALGENLPARDLLVSPAHAIALGGVLVQAAALVNGVSIAQESRLAERFTYYHVELSSHELLMSEGVASESFVDNADRMNFDNWAEHEMLGETAAIAEMALPRAKSSRQVPAAVRRLIAERATAFMPETIAA